MYNPKVSAVMPVYNRAWLIEKVLEGLLRQTYDNLEIVLIDDGSSDNIIEVMKKYPNVKFVTQENKGPAGARNTGIWNSTGEIVHFIDSDVFTPPNLIETHVRIHEKQDNLIVQGQIVRIMKIEDAYKAPFTMSNYSRSFFDTANVSVKRKHLETVKGFDEETFKKGWEDLDLGLRLVKAGCKVKRLFKEAFVWHYEGSFTPENMKSFFADRMVEGSGGLDFYRKHPTFEVKMMTMIGPFFFWLDSVLFNEEYLLSDKFYKKVMKLWNEDKKDAAIAKIRIAGYHFHFKAIKERIAKEGYILKKP